jgi:uncharacterized protein
VTETEPNPYAYAAANQPPLSPSDERTWSLLTHLLSMFFGFIPALVFYLIYKDRGPFVRAHSVTEWNFQLTLLIASFAGFLVAFGSVFGSIAVDDGGAPPPFGLFFLGYFLILGIDVLRIIFGIIASIAANRGQFYRYPIAIRFVKA